MFADQIAVVARIRREFKADRQLTRRANSTIASVAITATSHPCPLIMAAHGPGPGDGPREVPSKLLMVFVVRVVRVYFYRTAES
jgi:hypothetical protein